MFKNITLFSCGVIVGGLGGYLYWKKKNQEFEKKCEQKMEKEIEEIKTLRMKICEKNIVAETQVDETKNEKTNVQVLLPTSYKKDDCKPYINYHQTKPSIEELNEKLLKNTEYYNTPSNHEVYTSDIEIIEYDTYSDGLPLGYDSDCLEYYMINDVLITDNGEEIYNDIVELLGIECYNIIQHQEGPVYIVNHKMQMVYEIISKKEYYTEFDENTNEEGITEQELEERTEKYNMMIEEGNSPYEKNVKRKKTE